MAHSNSARIRASIIGVTGYTGVEVLRLLVAHPFIDIAHLTSRQHDNAPLKDVFPHLSHLPYIVSNPSLDVVAADSDVVFIALPHKTAQPVVAALFGKTKIIDLSADFRLDDAATYEQYYNTPHEYPELLSKVVYGFTEANKETIATSSAIANPGCYALLAQTMLYPLRGLIQKADVFAISGTSGAGKTPTDLTHHPLAGHNIKSYNINKHRHIPEIIRSAGITTDQLNFTPTLGPYSRGIFAHAVVTLKQQADAAQLFHTCYQHEPFVRITDSVSLAHIIGSNYIDVSVQSGTGNSLLIQGALDNLMKGSAGSAVQNMNIMFGIAEETGLNILSPLYP